MSLEYYFSLLVKLGVAAGIASVLARSNHFKTALMRENRTLPERLKLGLWFSVVYGASVAARMLSHNYQAADLGLEGSLLAGILGGYVTGLFSGILISIPAVCLHQAASLHEAASGPPEPLTMLLLAGIGLLGGVLRDLAPDAEEIWRFSPFLDLNLVRFFREKRHHQRAAFHLLAIAGILSAEFLRQVLGGAGRVFSLEPEHRTDVWPMLALYASTLLAVTIPLKIWNNTRNEKKLEEQARRLVEARLAALTSQINPHFLFNTLNSVSSLVRTDPDQARVMVVKLSRVLRRLLRKHDTFNALRDELNFIEDYLGIEVVRFGDKLRFERDIAEETLDMLVPSMLLQPLVENCIKHGLSSKVEGGTIRIRTQRTGDRLRLLVEDDGVGIPESELATLLDRGIGVSNVNERLKVLFGNQYRMWIDSQPGHGTRIEIEMPELQTEAAAV